MANPVLEEKGKWTGSAHAGHDQVGGCHLIVIGSHWTVMTWICFKKITLAEVLRRYFRRQFSSSDPGEFFFLFGYLFMYLFEIRQEVVR